MDTNPPLQGAPLLRTQIELVSSTTAAGILYGIAFSLYYLSLHVSLPLPLDRDRRRQAQFVMTCSTTIMICGLYFLVFNAWVIQDAYIKHGNFPGGPLIYENSTFHTQPVIAVGLVCQVVIDILTVAFQIWRLWVIWSGTRYARVVVILPLLCLSGFIALRVRMIVLNVTIDDPDLMSKNIKPDTSELALRGAAITLPTILIAGFLIFESRRQSTLTGDSKMSSLYMNVVVMLIESYALDSAWIMVIIVLLVLEHPMAQFFNNTQAYMEIIAHTLMLYRLRLATRRAYESQRTHGFQNEQECNMSSVHWNPAPAQSYVTGETDTDINLQAERDTLHR